MNWFKNAIANSYRDLEESTGNLEVTKVNSNFSSQTIRELRALARERCLRGYSKLRKAELVVLLENTEMQRAAREGVELCRKYGATNFDEVMAFCAIYCGDRISVVGLFKGVGFEAVHRELFQYHHKREFFRRIRDELLPIAWHPDRFWNWCVDEEEKGFLEGMWES